MIWDELGPVVGWFADESRWDTEPKDSSFWNSEGFLAPLPVALWTLPRCQDANDLPLAFQAKQNEEIGVQHLGSGRKVDIQVASYQNPRIFGVCVCVCVMPSSFNSKQYEIPPERVYRYGLVSILYHVPYQPKFSQSCGKPDNQLSFHVM